MVAYFAILVEKWGLSLNHFKPMIRNISELATTCITGTYNKTPKLHQSTAFPYFRPFKSSGAT